jgi:peptidoglycan L-alanyl-D-glutamate endopeptidase CwlK
MSSRKIEDLTPELQELFHSFEKSAQNTGVEFIVTCTYRSQYEQGALYAQGRTAPGKIVTWNVISKHTEHKAFDIAVLKSGKVSWDPADYAKAGEIGEAVGLVWGGRWTRPDYPHFQLKEA